jgi:CubicO group peptidase (beta-lactamase class C family)
MRQAEYPLRSTALTGIILRFGIMFLTSIFPLSPLRAATPAQTAALIDADLQAAATHGFGGAMVIMQDGHYLLRRGYGYANRETGRRFTPETIAQIGSITKNFTALAIARLAAEGRIDLGATVGTYIRDAPEPARSLTVNQLLLHRSGLMQSCGEDFDRVSRRQLLETCLSRPLAFNDGAQHYSNLGYSLLALVVEAASGMSWEDYLRRSIWQPLGMRSAGYSFAHRDQSGFASGYMNGNAIPAISSRIGQLAGEDWNLRGNGGIQASADDMLRFLAAIVGPSAIPERARQLLIVPHGPREGHVAEGCGFFFHYADHDAVQAVGNAGSDGVFYSMLIWYPQSHILIYFVGNNGEDAVKSVLRGALRRIRDLPALS